MGNSIMQVVLVLSFLNWNCNELKRPGADISQIKNIDSIYNLTQIKLGNTVRSRIKTPDKFNRTQEETNSFQEYLRNLKLKPHGSFATYFNGSKKPNNDVYEAVVNLEIGTKDLHQCADAVMRLRAEYLWKQEKYSKIHFNFTNGFKVEYTEWMKGKRMNVNGNRTWWSQKTTASNTYDDFWNYMELIFMYAGTASLDAELNSKNIDNAEIGDILIQGGHPGHAVIIIDKATNDTTGQSVYLLAQSYMPAQEIQVLKNPMNSNISPWYAFHNDEIVTPEWKFNHTDLKVFNQ